MSRVLSLRMSVKCCERPVGWNWRDWQTPRQWMDPWHSTQVVMCVDSWHCRYCCEWQSAVVNGAADRCWQWSWPQRAGLGPQRPERQADSRLTEGWIEQWGKSSFKRLYVVWEQGKRERERERERERKGNAFGRCFVSLVLSLVWEERVWLLSR